MVHHLTMQVIYRLQQDLRRGRQAVGEMLSVNQTLHSLNMGSGGTLLLPMHVTCCLRASGLLRLGRRPKKGLAGFCTGLATNRGLRRLCLGCEPLRNNGVCGVTTQMHGQSPHVSQCIGSTVDRPF